MTTLEYRRHARREPGGVHLNAIGLAAARRVGAGLGRFDRALASTLPRAIETAEALGAPAVETRRELGELPGPVEAALGPIVDWADFARAVARSASVDRFARAQAELLAGFASSLPVEGRGLVVSHGSILELGVVGALPTAPFARWGGPARYLEGVRLDFAGGRFVGGEPLRVADPI